MLARCESFISQMAINSYKVWPKRAYRPIMNLPAYTANINTIERRNNAFTRSYASSSDINQIGKKSQVLNMDINTLTKTDINLMLQPIYYAQAVPKENIRSHIIKGFNYWMNLPDDIIKTVEDISTIYYESILLIDDIHDESDYRRGLPTSHKIFGMPLTYMSSQASLFLVMKKLIELDNMKSIEIYVDLYLKFCVSTYKELYCRQNMICPTMHEYEQLFCCQKCDGIIGLPFQLMQLFSDCKTDYSNLQNLLFIHQGYQNDLANLCEEKCWNTKSFCEDISEGKYTLAAIHAVNSGTVEGDIVSSIYRQKTKDVPTLQYCLSLMQKLGSIDFAKKAADSIEMKLREEIERLGGNPLFIEYIETINSWGYDEKFIKN